MAPRYARSKAQVGANGSGPPASPDSPDAVRVSLTAALGRRVRDDDLDGVPTAMLHRVLLERRRTSPTKDSRASDRSQRGDYQETGRFLPMVARMIRSAGRRVGDGGDIEMIGELDRVLREECDRAVGGAFWALLRAGYSSREIAERLGVRKQSAFERFARFRPADMPPGSLRPGNGNGGDDEGE